MLGSDFRARQRYLLWAASLLFPLPILAADRTVDVEQVRKDIITLSTNAVLKDEASFCKTVKAKLNRLYAEPASGILANVASLAPYQATKILGLLGVGAATENSVKMLLDEAAGGLTQAVAGFEGSTSTRTVHSLLNSVLNLIVQDQIGNKIGLASSTAMENGRTIWAKLKYLYSDMSGNTVERLGKNIDSTFSDCLSEGEGLVPAINSLLEADTGVIALMPGLAISGDNAEESVAVQVTTFLTSAKEAVNAMAGGLLSGGDQLPIIEAELRKAAAIATNIVNPDILTQFAEVQTRLMLSGISAHLSAANTLAQVVEGLRMTIEAADAGVQGADEVNALRGALSGGNEHTVSELDAACSTANEKMSDVNNAHTEADYKTIAAAVSSLCSTLSALKTLSSYLNPGEADDPSLLPESLQAQPSFAVETRLGIFAEGERTSITGLQTACAINFSQKIGEASDAVKQLQEGFSTETSGSISSAEGAVAALQASIARMQEQVRVMNLLSDLYTKASSSTATDAENTELQNNLAAAQAQIGDSALNSRISQILRSYLYLSRDAADIQLLGSPDDLALRKPYTVCQMLNLVNDNITQTAYILQGDHFKTLATGLDTMLTTLTDVIKRTQPVSVLDTALTSMYRTLVQNFTEYSSDFFPMPSGSSSVVSNNAQEELTAFLTKHKSNGGSVGNTFDKLELAADLGKIARIVFYQWPDLCAAVESTTEEVRTQYVGQLFQLGVTFNNMAYEAQGVLTVDQTLTRIGRSGSTSEKPLLAQIKDKATKNSVTVNLDDLLLLRNLLEKCPAIAFQNVAEIMEEEEAPQTAPVALSDWLSEHVGVETDVYTEDGDETVAVTKNSLFALTHNLEADPAEGGTNLSLTRLQTKLSQISGRLVIMVQRALVDDSQKSSRSLPALQTGDWLRYDKTMALLLNTEKTAITAGLTRSAELYAQPLIFSLKGEPGVTERRTLYQALLESSDAKAGTPTDLWAFLGDAQTFFSTFNYVCRLLEKCSDYLSESLGESTVYEQIYTKTTDLSIAQQGPKSLHNGFIEPFFNLAGTVIEKDPDAAGDAELYVITGTSGDETVTTKADDPTMTLALTIIGLPTTALDEKVQAVQAALAAAKESAYPMSMEKILIKLRAVQTALGTVAQLALTPDSASSIETTIALRNAIGRSADEVPEMPSIFGCLNSVLRETGAAILANQIGVTGVMEAGSLLYAIQSRAAHPELSNADTMALRALESSAHQLRDAIRAHYTYFSQGETNRVCDQISGWVKELDGASKTPSAIKTEIDTLIATIGESAN